jgi:hypothetical protein
MSLRGELQIVGLDRDTPNDLLDQQADYNSGGAVLNRLTAT